jgi:hypothetical protein
VTLSAPGGGDLLLVLELAGGQAVVQCPHAGVPRLLPGQTRVASIDLAGITQNIRTRLRSYGYQDLADNDERTLEELLRLPSAPLIVTLLVNDGWTGATHYRESPRYHLSDIRCAYFSAEKTGVANLLGRGRRRLRPMRREVRDKWHSRVLRRHKSLRFWPAEVDAARSPDAPRPDM